MFADMRHATLARSVVQNNRNGHFMGLPVTPEIGHFPATITILRAPQFASPVKHLSKR